MATFDVELRCVATGLPTFELKTTVQAAEADYALAAATRLIDPPWPDEGAGADISEMHISIVRVDAPNLAGEGSAPEPESAERAGGSQRGTRAPSPAEEGAGG